MLRIGRVVLVTAVIAAVAGGAALAGIAAVSKTQATRLTVTEVEYKLTLSRTHVSAGATTFVVVDKGKLAHSLSISGPGLKKRLIAGTIKPGTSRTVSVTLKAGTFTLWCPQPGHAALGMKTSLKVGTAGTKSTWG